MNPDSNDLNIESKNKADMEKLITYLKMRGYEYDSDYDMSNVYFDKVFDDELWYFLLVSPHSGNKYRWMFRAEYSEEFDRWSIAGYEEFYDTIQDFMDSAVKDVEQYIKGSINHRKKQIKAKKIKTLRLKY